MRHAADADIIVVGSGHNSLIAAAYLATAGKRVLVLERNDYAGGGVASGELAEPGFVSERHALLHVRIMPNPLIANDELGLQDRYGLTYVPLETPMSAVFDDGSYIPISRDRSITISRINEISRHDAQAYDRFMELAVQAVDIVTPGLFVPPVTAREQAAALDATPVGREVLRATSMSVADVLAEWFEDERVRIGLSRMSSGLTLAHPEDLNTGAVTYLVAGLNERYGMALPRGGGSAFTEACIRCIEDHGGVVRTSVDVTRILNRCGLAVGVRTRDGEELVAGDAVLASIHPHRLHGVVDGLDPQVARTAALTKLAPYSAFVVHASLEEPLRFKAGSEPDGIIWNTLNGTSLAAMNTAFDDLRRGRMPALPLLEAGCPSVADPGRAPDGKAVLHMLCVTSLDLADGGATAWNAIKDGFADTLFTRLGQFATNITADTVRSRALVTPLDHEIDSLSFAGGDYTGIASYSHQMGGMRPTRELSRYTVPGIHRLYLTGPFMHPGGGVTGGGRATAIKMFEDLDLDFEQFRSGARATT
jgi:phytoene dehydrogenase-like protein